MAQTPENDLPLPTPPAALMARLDAMGIAYTLHHHKAVFTGAEAAFLKKDIPAVHVKNLFVRDKKERMALIVVPDEISLDLKALAPAIDLDRLSFGSPERLWTYLGVRPGSVCPFAAINDTEGQVKVVLDKSAADATFMCAHPMLNTMSVALSGADMVRFLTEIGHPPQILDLSAFERVEAA